MLGGSTCRGGADDAVGVAWRPLQRSCDGEAPTAAPKSSSSSEHACPHFFFVAERALLLLQRLCKCPVVLAFMEHARVGHGSTRGVSSSGSGASSSSGLGVAYLQEVSLYRAHAFAAAAHERHQSAGRRGS